MKKFDKQSDKVDEALEGGDGGLAQSVPSSPSVIFPGNTSPRASTQNSEDTSTFSARSSGVSGSRRVWLRRGVLAASPVVASLISMPVHAGLCISASAMGSPGPNSRPAKSVACNTLGPDSWVNNLSIWPSGTTVTSNRGVTTSILLKDAFGVSPNAEPGPNNPTLNQVLLGVNSQFGRYAVAAYLNAKKGIAGFPLTEQQAITVYKSYRPGPVQAPLVLNWNELDALAWLKVLMS